MGAINDFIKMSVLNTNFFIFILSITLIGIATFILVSDWGTLDPQFFIGWCIILILFGGTVILLAILGCLGVKYQNKNDGKLIFFIISQCYHICYRFLDWKNYSHNIPVYTFIFTCINFINGCYVIGYISCSRRNKSISKRRGYSYV
jgi:hypothetical protein